MGLRGWTLGATAVVLLALACESGPATPAPGNGGGGGSVPTGGGVGDKCTGVEPCRKGLECKNGVCEFGHSIEEGAVCVLSGECQDGLQCILGTCQTAGSGVTGDSCTSDADCESGYRCVLSGFGTECAPEGTGDVGDECTKAGDCYAGLTCTLGKCGKAPPGVPTFGVSAWQGVACAQRVTSGIRAFFELPGVTSPAGQEDDFFRLPFPNDARVKGGKLVLDGFPTPGADLLGFDPVQVYVDALQQSESAWGTSPTVIFRFSGEVDFDSFSAPVAGKYPIDWVDITAGTPEYGSSSGLYWMYSPNKTHYVCPDFIALRRPNGAPMTPGHKYAAFLTVSGKDAKGNPIERSEHLKAVLADTTPSDAALAAAHGAYADFRAYLKDKLIAPDTILNAAVFTAGKVREPMQKLATLVQAAPVPSAKSWVKCGGGAKSPCPQADAERACGDGSAPEYDEYHALVTLPVFQQGTAPYLDSGGGVRLDQPERSEDVCLALTVPKGGTMPANGWPLVVFAHGTGGSFRSHVNAGVAGALSQATTPTGSVGFAVLGIDQVQHGPRRGSSTASPDDLFFNFKNPAAARGNPTQGAVDQLALARFAATLDLTTAQTGGAAVKIDANALVFYGHSQGATHGSLALPYADGFDAAVLSGNGASLIYALLGKTQPVNIKGALPFVLADMDADGALEMGDMHPALTLLQIWIDPADPLNYARAIGAEPETGHTPKHVFQTYGLGDHFSPPNTLQAFVLAGGLGLAKADASVTTPEAIGDLEEKPVPLAGNVTVGTTPVTLAVRQYAPPSGKDGHFVAFDVANATADVARFLGMAANGTTPAVGQ